jgi:hypothetical protein
MRQADMKLLQGVWPIGAIALVCLFLLWGSQLNHDTSWYLISTRWWLHGVPLYQEISELNPPLAFYLTAPPVFFADVLALDATLAMQIYVIIIAVIVLLWARMILISSGEYTAAEVACLTLIASFALMILPLANFAQREHLMMLFTWPYVAMSLTTPSKPFQKQAVFVGLFAALGLALKPYFLLIPLFITITQIARSKSIRPLFSTQNLTILGFCVLYVLAARVLHPAYFSKTIPQALLTYGAYSSDFWYILSLIYVHVALGLPVGFFALRYQKPGSPVSAILISAALAGLASYFIQSKGFGYHLIPYQTYMALLFGWVIFLISAHFKHHRLAALFSIIPISLILIPAFVIGPYKNPAIAGFAKYLTCPRGQRSFQMFSASVWPSFPMANYADAIPANQAPALWRFPGAVRQLATTQDPKNRARLEAYMSEARADVINDFIRVEPQLIIVDNNRFKPYFGKAEFSYVEYFTQVPEFRTRWQNYSKVGEFYGFDIYRREGCEAVAQ